jgi:hypothetical protein
LQDVFNRFLAFVCARFLKFCEGFFFKETFIKEEEIRLKSFEKSLKKI